MNVMVAIASASTCVVVIGCYWRLGRLLARSRLMGEAVERLALARKCKCNALPCDEGPWVERYRAP